MQSLLCSNEHQLHRGDEYATELVVVDEEVEACFGNAFEIFG